MGSRLCEALHLTRACRVRALVHSTGSAARVARHPMEFVIADLCDRGAVDRAVEGCDAVVHLARGTMAVMRSGLENVLRASAKYRVARFVHMSSVAVYGNCPPPQSMTEDAPAQRSDLEYGNVKLRQEWLVSRYTRRYHLPAVILRPPNVYGPFSAFTLALLGKIRSGSMAIVDGGSNPCNLVYIDNLIEAVLLSLWKPEAIGQTFFVTDTDTITWERCLEDHASWTGARLPRISHDELVVPDRPRLLRDSLRDLPRVVFSSEFRTALRRVPVVGAAENFLYERFESLSADTKQSIRLRLHGPDHLQPVGGRTSVFSAADNIISAQARKVAHSSGKAQKLLGYRALVSYAEGMSLTEKWLRYSRALN